MAEVALTTEQFKRLVKLIATRAGVLTPLDRQNLLELAGLREFVPKLEFATTGEAFSNQLIRVLQNHGTLEQTGQPALVSLLKELATIVKGHKDEAAFIAGLLASYAEPDYAHQFEQASNLIDLQRVAKALPILESLERAGYRVGAVRLMLDQARQGAAEQVEKERAGHTEIGLLTRTNRPLEQATAFSLPLLEWLDIPAGQVTLEKGWNGKSYSTDAGVVFTVDPFKIAKYPVTNAQYQAFIEDDGYQKDRYWAGLAQRSAESTPPTWDKPTHPREKVNWYEAIAFTRWLSEKTGWTITLPTEWQWQWAAIGAKGWTYPYADTFDRQKSNTSESDIRKTTPVDRYPQGASPFGVMDLSGNVWEWCLNEYFVVQNVSLSANKRRVRRGGSWGDGASVARAAFRGSGIPEERVNFDGFRVVGNPPSR
jgi:formylglycine-generating enzyme required for sulfatase activity